MKKTFPEAFIQRLHRDFGQEAAILLDALQSSSPAAIRLHPEKKAILPPFSTTPIPWSSLGFYLDERPVYTLDPAFHGGAYYVQEPSSMFLEYALEKTFGTHKSIKILDLCAAPGGKSSLIAGWLKGSGLLISNEVIRQRVGILRENMLKWGYPNLIITNSDPESFGALDGLFDVIVVDAPCSGEGMFRKDETAIQEWSEKNIALCEARQRRILYDVLPALKPGGILIYSTCTFNPGENEECLHEIIRNEGLSLVNLEPPTSWNILEKETGCYYFLPHKIKGEGFFMAVLKKPGHEVTETLFPSRETVAPSFLAQIPEGMQCFEYKPKAMHYIFPEAYMPLIPVIRQSLKIVESGLELGTIKGKDFVPSPYGVFNPAVQWNFPSRALTHEQALKFLRKDTVPDISEWTEGWNLLHYHGINLGWAKKIGHRINNYYPTEWRIRMQA